MPKKLEDCVKSVKAKGGKTNAWAVCSASTGIKKKKGGGWTKEKTMKKESVDSKKAYVDFINGICNNDYATAKESLKAIVDRKLSEKIAKSSSKS